MKKIKYLIFGILLLFPFHILASDYEITSYHVNVIVNKNNTYDISEYYNLYFLNDSSFARNISLRPKVFLSNNKFITYITEVKNINSKNKYQAKQNSKYYNLIFNKEESNTSSTYYLNYAYNMGNDLDENNDIVFYDILDGSFDLPNNAITFTIKIDVQIDKERVNFYQNGELLDDEVIDYSIDSNVLSGTFLKQIEPGSVISLQMVLDEGYFQDTNRTDSNLSYLLLVLPILSFILGVYGVIRYKIKKTESNVGLSFMENYDSAEVGYLYRGYVSNTDIATLIIKLANDGYIKFRNYGSVDNIVYKIIKVKEYDKDNAAEKILFDGIFQVKNEIDFNNLEGILFPYYNDIKRTLDNRKNKKKFFYHLSDLIKIVIKLLAGLGIGLLNIKPFYNIIPSYLLVSIISIIIAIFIVFSFKKRKKVVQIILWIISLIIIYISAKALIDFTLNFVIYILGMFLLIISLILEGKIPIRTISGSQSLEDVYDFQSAILTLTAQALEEHPEYIYRILPYTYLFNLQNWWFKKWKDKMTTAPNWYFSSEEYTSYKLQKFISKLISDCSFALDTEKMHTDELLNQAKNKML